MSHLFSMSPDLYRAVFNLTPPGSGGAPGKKADAGSFAEVLEEALDVPEKHTFQNPYLPLSVLMDRARRTLDAVSEPPKTSEIKLPGHEEKEENKDSTILLPGIPKLTPRTSSSTRSVRNVTPI